MMTCDLASSPDGYVYVIFSLVSGLSHHCVLTQGTLLTFTGESGPQVPLTLLVPSLPSRMLAFGATRFHVGRHRHKRKSRRVD
jgi:hypothetical protein